MTGKRARNDLIMLDAVSSSGQCIALQGDVRDFKSCSNVVSQVVEKYQRVDILVNGAAGNFLASAEKLSSNGFKRVLEIDTLGTFNMSKAVFNQSMKENRSGNVINISALLHWNGTALQVHSSAAKAGVDAITKVLAVEWGPYGIRVNGIVPGAIEGTEGFERLGNLSLMNNKAATSEAAAKKSSSKGASDGGIDSLPVPMIRFGQVQDIANAALYLASPASDYVTGWNQVVDGGSFLTMPNMLFGYPNFTKRWMQAKL